MSMDMGIDLPLDMRTEMSMDMCIGVVRHLQDGCREHFELRSPHH